MTYRRTLFRFGSKRAFERCKRLKSLTADLRMPVNGGLCVFETEENLSFWVPEPTFDATSHEVCIRPERIRVGPRETDGQSPDHINRFHGTVQNVAHLGADIHLVVQLASGDLITISEQFTGQSLDQYGDKIEFTFLPQNCIIVAANS